MVEVQVLVFPDIVLILYLYCTNNILLLYKYYTNILPSQYAAITCRALPRLRFLLHNKRERTREIACQALSHIAIGSVELVQVNILVHSLVMHTLFNFREG